jgi:hypothetical protein
MRLIEEYLCRHDITNVTLVHHCSNGSLLLQNIHPESWNSPWIILNIKWMNHDYHPGEYHFNINVPIHDSCHSDSIFYHKVPTIKKWHEYEDFLLQWIDDIKNDFKPIIGIKEVVLSCWEMFVYIYDSWFLDQKDEIKSVLFESLDTESSIQDRYKSYQEIAAILSDKHPFVFRIWKYEVLSRTNKYANWLAVAINNQCKNQKNILTYESKTL